MNQVKARFFDAEAAAPWAAAAYGEAERPKLARLLSAAEVGPGTRVLEVGCGTGRLTALLADAVGPEGHVVALDISPKMLAACRARLGARPTVEFVCAAAEEFTGALPMDVAVCHQVYPHFDTPPAALKRITHALRPGGRLVIAHFLPADRVNAIHQQADPILQDDRLPPVDTLAQLLRTMGLSVDWAVEDALGYLVRARVRRCGSAR